jgi:tetraacyldisaccharide 4'-kinase
VNRQAPRYWQTRNGTALLLYPFSLLFRLLAALRRQGYNLGLFSQFTAHVPVVVVGNLTVGGAGKTPLVMSLVEQLQRRGWRPGIVSRGYGGEASQSALLVTANTTAEQAGDEALMMSKRTGVPVAVCARRAAAVSLLTSQHDCNVIVCDDGLQHYALARQFELCVIDSQAGVGNGWCLPAGPLREPVSRLKKVDAVVYSGGLPERLSTGSGVFAAPDSTSIFKKLSRYRGAPMQGAYQLRVEAVVNLSNPDRIGSLADFSADNVHAVAAIGRPDKFFQQLRSAGLDITEHAFADHHQFQPQDLEFGDDNAVLMTEKDSVKCAAWARPNHWYVKVVAELDSGIVDAVHDGIHPLLKE